MNQSDRRRHPIDNLFTIALLGLFLIFLLMMLLFSAQAYRTAVAGTDRKSTRLNSSH